jgi:Do/DeqQ family serine protease
MTDTHFTISKRAARAVVGSLGALLLVGGLAWNGLAQPQSSDHAAATAQHPAITHAIAGSRDSYADVVDVVAPAVVTIRTEGKATVSPTQFQGPDDDFFRQFFGMPFGQNRRGGPGQPGPSMKQHALGSGVIVTPDGYILTNNHVVDHADTITVDFGSGRTLDAKVIGTDAPTDLALLKIDGTDYDAVQLGNSDNVRVGDVVLAVGNPLGIGETVTMGIISAKGRSTAAGDGNYEDFLQTDAPINHGNSGGALVNTKGELIGINSQILSNSDGNIGIGFAIPVNMAKSVMDQLRTSGKVTRAQLGVTIQNVSSDMAKCLGLKQAGGVIVSAVSTGSAADRAGVKQGDVITALDGKPVENTNALRNHIAQSRPGTTADLTILRDGSERHISVKLDELQGSSAAEGLGAGDGHSDKGLLGVSVEPLTPQLAERLGVKSTHGLVVDEVTPDGRAATAGIQAGDVIESVNRQAVSSVDALREALSKTPNRPALLLINRDGHEIFVTVRPAAE